MIGQVFARYREWFQAFFFVVFVGLLLLAAENITLPVPSQLFLYLDPLISLFAIIAGQSLIAIAAYSIITVVFTILFGRVFCGYMCPLGTIIDQFASLSEVFNIKQKAFKKIKVLPLLILALVLTLSFYSIGAAMIFDPISLTTRAATIAIATVKAVIDQLGMNLPLDQFGGQGGAFGNGFDQPSYVGGGGAILISTGWILLFLAAIIGLNLLGKRFWCRYLCPLGALLGLIGRIPLIRRKVDPEACVSCMKCAKSCDMQAVTKKGQATDAANCTLCLECVDVCPKNAITAGLKPELTTEVPSRRTALAVLGGTAAAVALAPLTSQASPNEAAFIRPPGVSDEEKFLSMCIRCGECVAACPTKVLQPAFLQNGLEALWTPQLDFTNASCSYNCNSCGNVCPTGAIQYLALAKKQAFAIGTAQINEEGCRRCARCAQLCPVPGGAIKFGIPDAVNGMNNSNGSNGLNGSGNSGGFSGPNGSSNGGHGGRSRGSISVDSSKCIGCGVCVQVCPVRDNKPVRIVKNEAGGTNGAGAAVKQLTMQQKRSQTVL
jgi:polyferredoxin